MFKKIKKLLNSKRKKMKVLDLKVYIDRDGVYDCDIDFNGNIIDKEKMTLDRVEGFVRAVSKEIIFRR